MSELEKNMNGSEPFAHFLCEVLDKMLKEDTDTILLETIIPKGGQRVLVTFDLKLLGVQPITEDAQEETS